MDPDSMMISRVNDCQTYLTRNNVPLVCHGNFGAKNFFPLSMHTLRIQSRMYGFLDNRGMEHIYSDDNDVFSN
jgi:hypothetical protein